MVTQIHLSLKVGIATKSTLSYILFIQVVRMTSPSYQRMLRSTRSITSAYRNGSAFAHTYIHIHMKCMALQQPDDYCTRIAVPMNKAFSWSAQCFLVSFVSILRRPSTYFDAQCRLRISHPDFTGLENSIVQAGFKTSVPTKYWYLAQVVSPGQRRRYRSPQTQCAQLRFSPS